ncbi:hypothetical protein HPB52_010721 [Rhipicephalus sanguineus]|uniref:Uncharacterized protein n=1 Tax=Rhipicephalus sanguineus TaxID=34632 RepID=A0A9D4SZX1_RHISA|nr:hypothetical protein HPB52_010721 [Rhipicephalus sanguineus]
MNAHHTMDLVDVIHQLGLQVLNTGSFTFAIKTGRPSCTSIDVSLDSDGDRFDCAMEPDSWVSDHLPIVITPAGGKIPRTRHFQAAAPRRPEGLGLPESGGSSSKHPVPDLHPLNLRAARRRAEIRYLKAQCPDHRTLLQPCRCGMPATCQPSQTADRARGGAKAWRLLRSLVIRPLPRQPVLAAAIRLGISEQERLADRFATLPLARTAAITTTPAPKPPRSHHPTWTASQISDFDRLPDMVVESALDALGITDCLCASINAFLAGRTLRVRAGCARYPTQCSLYVDDVALWVRGPKWNLTAIRRPPQSSLDAVTSFFRAIRLVVSPTKTETLLVHPRVTARRAIPRLVLGDQPIPWSQALTYLGLRIDHYLTCIPAIKLATFEATSVQTAVGKRLSRGQACTPRLALQLYEGAATAVRTNALPMVQLAPHRKKQLER